MAKALIGAGCFWSVEEYFSKINGIQNTKVGYSGGDTNKPTYEEVCSGKTGLDRAYALRDQADQYYL